jgi:hypothetical protein
VVLSATNRAPVALSIVNATDATVCFLHVSACSDDAWGDDILGPSQVLQAGATATVQIVPGCWDFRADDCSRTPLATRVGNRITGPSQWTVTATERTPDEPIAPGQAVLEIINAAPVPVCNLYISPCEDTVWGEGLLAPGDPVPPGEHAVADVPTGCFDLRADDCQGGILHQQMRVRITGDLQWVIQP